MISQRLIVVLAIITIIIAGATNGIAQEIKKTTGSVSSHKQKPVIVEGKYFINKPQLSSLKSLLKDVMRAGRLSHMSFGSLFENLQVRNAKTMAQSGLVPEFLIDLPYKSKLMNMTNELWDSWSMDEGNDFLREIDAKLKAYESILNSPEGWKVLKKGDSLDKHVFPLSVDLLP